jgi:hypothetical protein
MYDLGRGVPQDYAEAAKMFRKAADQGYAVAQFALGGMYVLGQGVPKSFIRAYVWFSLAAAQGHKDASKYLDLISANMSPDWVAEARRLAQEWNQT